MCRLTRRQVQAAQRRLDARRRRRSRRDRPLAVESPRQVERAFERAILRMRAELWRMIDSRLMPALKASERSDSWRQDDLAKVVSVLAAMRKRMRSVFPTDELRRVTERYAAETDKRHRAAFYRQLSDIIGVDVLAVEPWHKVTLRSWSREATGLIQSVRDSAIPAMRKEIEATFATGLRHEELRKRWIQRGLPLDFGTLEGRAKVIARDQINKLNGQLTQARQEGIGIRSYTWRTSGDHRVRDEHVALAGTVHSWDNPPSEGHPGHAVQCRCTAEAVINVAEIAAAQNLLPVRAADLDLLEAA